MNLFKQYFRIWWQYPREIGDRSEHRSVSFLELFYDLVYVVLIAELAHSLAGHIDFKHLGEYFFLFIIVWLSWFNGMSYHDIHGNNDIRTRIFTFIQMACVSLMAAFAHGALDETSTPFALAYGAFQLTLTFLWWRVGVHDRVHRGIAYPYSLAFLLATFLFVGSVFLPASMRPYFWSASVLITLVLPSVVLWTDHGHDEVRKEQQKLLVGSPSMVERYGLFTIIVLGEVVVGVVSGLGSNHHFSFSMISVALLGILIAASLWWVYFDFVSHRIPIARRLPVTSWTYLHLPLTAAIAAAGAAILNVVEGYDETLLGEVRWLLVGSIAASLLCIGLIILTLQLKSTIRSAFLNGSRIMVGNAILVAFLGLYPVPTVLLLILLCVFLLLPVYFGIRVWLQFNVDEEGGV